MKEKCIISRSIDKEIQFLNNDIGMWSSSKIDATIFPSRHDAIEEMNTWRNMSIATRLGVKYNIMPVIDN